METIAWLGFSQGLFAAILMMTKKERTVADKLLTAWLSLLSIEFLTCSIDFMIFGTPLLSSSFLLFNPAFYFYSKSLIDSSFKLKWVQLLHLIPFIFFESLAYILKEPYSLGDFFDPDSTLWFRYFFSIASFLSWIFYNTATSSLILRHRKRLLNELSNIESNSKVGWLLFIVVFYNTYSLILMVVSLVSIVSSISLTISHVYNYSTMLLMVYILGFYGLRQQKVIQDFDNTLENGKYSRSNLNQSQKLLIQEKLLGYFKKEMPYLNPELNMDSLSQELDIPKYQLTEVLNTNIGKNFFQFVNEYRIKAVIEKLLDPNNLYSIEAIGYDCGFSSKSSFFTVFKKFTGMTPQKYRMTMIINK